MTKNKNLLVLWAAVVVCTFTIAVSRPDHNRQERYEVNNEITLPEYRSDLDKMIDAYERMLDKVLYANGSGVEFNSDVNMLLGRMTEIDNKLNLISARLTGIEDALKNRQKSEKPLVQNDANNINITDGNSN